jgi:hypothetical protein
MSEKPECIITPNGTKRWYLNGNPHREDGPAIEYANGTKYWWLNGERHREDGPAVEWPDGYKEWYLNGEEYTEQEYYKELYYLGLISYNEYILEMI